MPEWRLLITDPAAGHYNMAVDEAIMRSHREGSTPPTLRFYSWKPPALSLGYFQQIEEIDREACRKKGIDIVRRLTGGRAILHDEELTYSLTVREDLDLLSDSVVESYRQISEGLVGGLQKAGVQAELKPRQKGKKAPSGKSSACFDAPSWYEIVSDGKKLIGSAQTRKKGAILQHGSLPFRQDSKKIFDLFNFSSDHEREKLRRFYSLKSTSLGELGADSLSFEDLSEALSRGISEALSIDLKTGSLTEKERRLAGELAREKYKSSTWNYRR